MRAGKLRHRITLEQSTPTDNSLGEPIDTWTTFATVWAQITPVNGKEYFAAAQERAQISHKIKIRYLSGITTGMRINFSDRLFDIQSVINFQEKNRDMEIMAIENV